jgi:hypothetical protein
MARKALVIAEELVRGLPDTQIVVSVRRGCEVVRSAPPTPPGPATTFLGFGGRLRAFGIWRATAVVRSLPELAADIRGRYASRGGCISFQASADTIGS